MRNNFDCEHVKAICFTIIMFVQGYYLLKIYIITLVGTVSINMIIKSYAIKYITLYISIRTIY